MSRTKRPEGRRTVLLFVAAAALLVTGCTELAARRAIQQGNADYGDGKYDEAVKSFEEAIQLAPELDVAYHNAALAYLKDMRPGLSTPEEKAKATKAAEYFETYLEMNPGQDEENEGVTKILVKTYMNAGDYDGALSVMQRELDKNPNDIRTIRIMAEINADARRFDESINWYRKQYDLAKTDAEKVEPLSSISVLQVNRLGGGMEIVGLERIAIADVGIGAIQEALALNPDNYILWYIAGSLYEQRSLAYEVFWLRNIDLNDAISYRIKGSELYKANQKKAAEAVGAGDAGDKNNKDGAKPSGSK